MWTHGGADCAIRREADQIEATLDRTQFRRRRAPDLSPDAERLVLEAVARAKLGDPDALRFLYLRYVDGVYGYVCSIVRDEHDAEDVTQHIFAKLITALGRYEPSVVPFAAWIQRVARNAAIDHMRARLPVPCEDVGAREVADDDAGGRERFADLRLALAAIPREQRDVLVLRFLIGLTPGEVAERLGRSEDAVHGLQHRGRRSLRREMQRIESLPLPA
jgi:RNA polymerase sigma-70 factor (ECF subfamily)